MSISRLMDRPIAFQRTYVRLGVGVTGALMLSQAVYWSMRAGNGGWFYKDRDDWEEETGLSRREQETARARLKKAGFLIEERRGLPCRLYFKVDHDALDEALLALDEPRPTSRAESAQQAGTNPPSSEGGIRPSSTETTTETTTETSTPPTSTGVDADGGVIDDAFSMFWHAGMVKVSKVKARKKFEKIIKDKRLDPTTFGEDLARDIKARLSAGQLGFNKMHPTTYLNQERWTDELVPGDRPKRAKHHGLDQWSGEGLKTNGQGRKTL